MEQLQGFDFFPLTFNAEGALQSPQEWTRFKGQAQSGAATDILFIAHGFRNDEADARGLYAEFLGNFRRSAADAQLAGSLAGRRFLVGGVFWPSQAFRESFGDAEGTLQSADSEAAEIEAARQQLAELRAADPSPEAQATLDEAERLLGTLGTSRDAQDRFVDLVMSLVDDSELDPTEGLQQIRSQPGSELLDKLALPVILPTSQGEDEGGVASIGGVEGIEGTEAAGGTQGFGSFAASIAGRVGQFLNLTTWYIMKNRSGLVGAVGVAPLVRDLRRTLPAVRVHLVGHSLGGRLMAGCAKALAQPPAVQVDSLTLLQAAFSHFGLSADNRAGTPGFFRDVIEKRVVKGPMVATFSFQDSVVGRAYAIASRLAGDNVKAIGDRNDPFGGIGRNGAQNLKEAAEERLHSAGSPYTFSPGVVLCLDGSGGLITSHGDVRNANVTWAAASAIAAT